VRNPWPSLARLGDAPWGVWIGGLLGAFYVAGSIYAAPKLGAALLIAAVVAGQTIASVVIDQYGWVGFREQHITAGRVVGVALVAAGVTLVRVF
jgi:transporter family-2 protein